MFKITESRIPGCFELEFRKMSDIKGSFTKTFHEILSRELNINTQVAEEYFSHSSKNVLRGMHFQMPPKAIDKTMFCVAGKITDYVVDLRKGSPTFGEWASFELDAETPKAVFVPKGLAHGFFAHADNTIMQCKSSGVYDAANDVTLSYKGFGFAKNIKDPILSDRDLNAASFTDFTNPFQYAP